MKKIITLLSLSAALTFTASAPRLHAEDAPTQQSIVVIFDKPDKWAAPEGGVMVTWSDAHNGKISFAGFAFINKEGRCVFKAPVGSYLNIYPNKMTNYYFEPVRNFRVYSSPGMMLVKKLELKKAGAITGTVYDAQGNLFSAKLTQISVFNRKNTVFDFVDQRNAPYYVPVKNGEFTLYPVALDEDCKYFVMVSDGLNFAVSEPLALEEGKPVGHVTMRFKPGVKITGILRDERRQPVAGVQLVFCYKPDKLRFMRIENYPGLRTRADGSFEIPAINFDLRGEYTISMERTERYDRLCVELEKDMRQPLILTAEDR